MPRTKSSNSAVLPVPEAIDFDLQLPDPEDEKLSENEFQQRIEQAWQVCDRIDLQTDIWRGKILRAVRDREKKLGEGRGIGFLNWLKDREIGKSHAYNLIELANSADEMLAEGYLEGNKSRLADVADLLGFSAPSALSRWHKRHFGFTLTERRSGK